MKFSLVFVMLMLAVMFATVKSNKIEMPELTEFM